MKTFEEIQFEIKTNAKKIDELLNSSYNLCREAVDVIEKMSDVETMETLTRIYPNFVCNNCVVYRDAGLTKIGIGYGENEMEAIRDAIRWHIWNNKNVDCVI